MRLVEINMTSVKMNMACIEMNDNKWMWENCNMYIMNLTVFTCDIYWNDDDIEMMMTCLAMKFIC